MSADQPLQESARPVEGSQWRDREGNTWRLDHYCDGGPWCILIGVTRFDGGPFGSSRWHCDWMLDLVRKAEPVPDEPEPIGWVSPCCKTTNMTTRGGDGSHGSPCWTVCLACGETCEPEPVYER